MINKQAKKKIIKRLFTNKRDINNDEYWNENNGVQSNETL